MQILQCSSFPIDQVGNLETLELDLAAWFASHEFPTRLLAYSRAFNMRPAIERVAELQAGMERLGQTIAPLMRAIDGWLNGDAACQPAAELQAIPAPVLAALTELFAPMPALLDCLSPTPDVEPRARWAMLGDAIDRVLWRLPWTKETIRFYEALERRHLRSATYLLLTWEPADVSAESLIATLRHATGRPVSRMDRLPGLLACAYREHMTYLEPIEPGFPYYALLHSYDMQDEWDATTLHALLAAPYDVAIAIDVITLARPKAQRLAELAHNAAHMVARDHKLLDTRAERVTHDARQVLHEMRRQTLHEIQLAILVGGNTLAELEVHLADIRDRLGARLRLMRAAGAQREVLRLFGTTPRQRLEAPWKPRTQLSHAVGCLAGIVGLHRANATEGIFLGIDAIRRAPIFMDLFKQNQAAHTVVLGKTGYGKTVCAPRHAVVVSPL